MFTVPIKVLPHAIDPHNLFSLYNVIVGNQIHSSLMRLNSDLGLEMSLIENYSFSLNGLKLKIILKNKKFSDKTLLKPIHVINSIKRLFFLKSSMCADLDYIVGSKEALLGDIEKLKIYQTGDNEVTFDLSKKNVLILYHLASLDTAILKLDRYDQTPDLRVGLGQYQIETENSKEIILRAVNPGPNRIQKFKYIQVDAPNIFSHIQSKKIDTAEGYFLNKKQIESLKDQNWKEFPTTIVRQIYFVLNPDKVPLNVRSLFYNVLNSIEISEEFKIGSVKKMYGLVPNSIPGELTQEEARIIISQEKLKSDYKLKIYVQQGESYLLSLLKYVANKLKNHKIIMEIQELPPIDYVKIFHEKSVPAYLSIKYLDYPDAYSILAYFKTTDVNDSFFSSEVAVDNLLDMALEESDTKKRINIYKTVQLNILKKFTVIPLISGSEQLGLWAPQVENVPAHPMGFHSLQMYDVEMKK